jgi:hypothetical protein
MLDTVFRHYCRNQHCRSKLAEPVEDRRRAFCTLACHSSFYRRHCLVCEKELPPGPDHRKFCRKPGCKSEYRQYPHVYDFPGPTSQGARRAPKTPIKSGSFWCDKTGRGWRWEQLGDELWLFNREDEVQARLVPIDDLYIVRLGPGIDYGPPDPLDDVKRRAIALALRRLSPDPDTAARVTRANDPTRIQRDTAWARSPAIFGPDIPPLNISSRHRFVGVPDEVITRERALVPRDRDLQLRHRQKGEVP